MVTARDVTHALHEIANKEIASHSARFFKSGKGEYGEGDKFLGIRVPDQRQIAKSYRNLNLNEISVLLHSEYHEVRLTALFILVLRYQKADLNHKREIFDFYLNHLQFVNNWDLVDSSAIYIVGNYLYDKDRSVLFEFAVSDNLWKRRISIISTFYFIDQNDFKDTLKISEILLNDHEDLIHKACGWMLRETGKKDLSVLISFLNKYHKNMPRTMLRYAIEKFPAEERKRFLKGKF